MDPYRKSPPADGVACARVLRQECVWYVKGTVTGSQAKERMEREDWRAGDGERLHWSLRAGHRLFTSSKAFIRWD